MKKLISLLLLVVALATVLTACGKFDCGLCGKEKSGKKYEYSLLGKTVDICKDCQEGLEDIQDGLEDIADIFKK